MKNLISQSHHQGQSIRKGLAKMGVSGAALVLAAASASAGLSVWGRGTLPSWALLVLVLLLQLASLLPRLAPALRVVGPALVAAAAHRKSLLEHALVWSLCAVAALVWREKPSVEFELM